MPLVTSTARGLYCEAGGFHIDAWQPVERCIVTHAHGDHARFGHAHYLASRASEHVLRTRLGEIKLQTLAYGASLRIGEVSVSLHPAGHVLGSAQVRIEHRGEVWVVSGDYKLERDASCAPFEPVRCDTFVTESTFGLPIYRWREQRDLFAEIDRWWADNRAQGRASVLFAYAFGKAQRILAGIDASGGPIVCHGAVESLNAAYRASGVVLPATLRADQAGADDLRTALVIAPPSAQGTPWLRRFGDYADAFASGWMQVRGVRRRRAVDRGFALSDHADWPALLQAIEASGARQVVVTHGQVEPLVRWLREHDYHAQAFDTQFTGEQDDDAAATADAKAEHPLATADAQVRVDGVRDERAPASTTPGAARQTDET